MRRRAFSTAALAFLLAHIPTAAQACTACMGDPSSKTAGAINAAIFLMLGVLALMLGSFVAFGFYLVKHASSGSAVPGVGSTDSNDPPDALS